MRSSLPAPEDVAELHATEAHCNLGPSAVLYIISGLCIASLYGEQKQLNIDELSIKNTKLLLTRIVHIDSVRTAQ